MLKHLLRNMFLPAILLSGFYVVTAQDVQEPTVTNAEWSKPYPPFRIAGNLYYVGTYDLGCYLITTSQGDILINTGLAASASLLKNNIEKLGFKLSDIKILLTTQAHYDHLGAMAALKEMTGARVLADEGDASVMADGGSSDYAMGGGHGKSYKPVTVDTLMHDRDTIRLGNLQLVMLHHPGHTKGSCSFLFDTRDRQRSYRVLIANMPTIVTEKKFSDVTDYPGIAKDYAYTLQAMKYLSFDIWVASHASQFDLHNKHKPGDRYNPAAFIDRAGYDNSLKDLQKQYDEHLNRH